MGKLAIIAEEDVAAFFRASGIRNSYGVKSAREAEDLLWKLVEKEEIAVIAITESIVQQIRQAVDEVSKRIYPTVITIPGKEGPIPEMAAPIMELVKRTVGVEIKL